MSKVEPHPTDKGKYQSTVDSYGHGKGNGKSKTAIYKHLKSANEKEIELDVQEDNDIDDSTPEWQNLDWLHPDDEEEVPSSLPKAVQGIVGGGEYGPAHRATQRQLVIWGYMGLDRLISQWGKGVTQDKTWNITRSSSDYAIMEEATTSMMDSHGIKVQMSPTLVWGTVMVGAYGPPTADIVKKADPFKRKSIVGRIKRLFRRNKKFVPPIKEDNDGKSSLEKDL
jgi:hypothetical protein